jgi:predicted DNA binding CopG/RHH family protein
MPKQLPNFKSEGEERAFWSSHDSSEYIDWKKAKKVVFPNLKPTTRTISLRLPESLYNDLKAAANRRDVPYQSYLKVILQQSLEQERHSHPRK